MGGKRNTSRTALAALTMSLLGCHLARRPFTGPEAGGAEWVEVTSPHFSVRSDLGPSDAKSALNELEVTYAELHDLAFPYEDAPQFRTRVVHFRRTDEFNEYRPRDVADGYFQHPLPEEDVDPSLVTRGPLTNSTRRLLHHELTHDFIHFYYPRAPIWFNEGMAEYCSTIAVESGTAILGRSPYRFVLGDTWVFYAKIADNYEAAVPSAAVPTVRQLLEMDGEAFYDADAQPQSATDKLEHQRRVEAHYAGAWALVHLLKNGKEAYRARFERFLTLLAHGAPGKAAWTGAFGDVDEALLEQDLRESLTAYENVVLRTAYTPRADAIAQVRTLTPAEVHVLWAELRRLKQDDQRAKARAEVDAALRLDPGSAPAKVEKARIQIQEGDLASAEQTLADAARNGRDEASLYTLFRVRLLRALRASPGKAQLKEVDDLLPALLAVAVTPRRQNGIARYLTMRGKSAEAERLIGAALHGDAGCAACFDTYGMLLADKGASQEAVDAESLAIAIDPHGSPIPSATARLEIYRLRAAAKLGTAGVLGAMSKTKIGSLLKVDGLELMTPAPEGPLTHVSVSLREQTDGRFAGAAALILVDGRLARVVIGRGHPYFTEEHRPNTVLETDLPQGKHRFEVRYVLDAGGYEVFGLLLYQRAWLTSAAEISVAQSPVNMEVTVADNPAGDRKNRFAIRWSAPAPAAP